LPEVRRLRYHFRVGRLAVGLHVLPLDRQASEQGGDKAPGGATALGGAGMGGAEMTHELKIHPEYFEAVRNGDKTFHLCRADREHQVGDTLIFCSHGKRLDLVVKLKAVVTYIQEVYLEVEFLPVRYNILAIKVEK
jgi:hypothetical protein